MKATHYGPWGSISIIPGQKISLSERFSLTVAVVAILVLSFPHVTWAATLRETPMYFDVDSLSPLEIAKTAVVEAEIEQALAEVPETDPRVAILKNYLESKKSPMAQHADALLANPNYRYIIGISFAESNFCKYNIRPHNCWGIGGGSPESYSDYPAAFERANRLIQRYHERGMNTPAKMRTTWVGWHNDSWIVAVEQAMRQLQEIGL